MRILADSNVEFALVRWLRESEHGVVWAGEMAPGLGDSLLLELARKEGRIFLTHDLDFGELVFRRRLASFSVVLMRFSAPEQDRRLMSLQSQWPELMQALAEKVFVVLSESEIRVRPLSA